MDEDGKMAAAGRVNEEVLKEMMETEYFKLPPPKTTGK